MAIHSPPFRVPLSPKERSNGIARSRMFIDDLPGMAKTSMVRVWTMLYGSDFVAFGLPVIYCLLTSRAPCTTGIMEFLVVAPVAQRVFADELNAPCLGLTVSPNCMRLRATAAINSNALARLIRAAPKSCS